MCNKLLNAGKASKLFVFNRLGGNGLAIAEFIREFALTKEQLLFIVHDVETSIEDGLCGKESSLKMLPSYLGLPCGNEQGDFLALDFGGSNIRIARIGLADRSFEIIGQNQFALVDFLAGRKNVGCEELFLQIAHFVSEFAGGCGGFLGHTFSYPAEQVGANVASVKSWTKEVAVIDGDLPDINGLLREKLLFVGREDIVPIVVLNDTTAVLLSAAYSLATGMVIGSICGTGHNSCYYEPQREMVINLESGNYRVPYRNCFDQQLDRQSKFPGQQWLEKMTAGNYLSELVNLVAATGKGFYGKLETAQDLGAVLEDKDSVLYPVACAVVKRAAALLAAEYAGICNHLAKRGVAIEKIVIDGSVYNGLALFKKQLPEVLAVLMSKPPKIISGQGSSLTGAAVGAAIYYDKAGLGL